MCEPERRGVGTESPAEEYHMNRQNAKRKYQVCYTNGKGLRDKRLFKCEQDAETFADVQWRHGRGHVSLYGPDGKATAWMID